MPRLPRWSPFLLALPLRVLSALLALAFFQPDEYWQNLEPAHRWVWGYGAETWEWRSSPGAGLGRKGWEETLRVLAKEGGKGGIRSPMSVLPTAAVYWVLKALGWEDGRVLVLAPRLLQAVFAASTDVAIYRLAKRILGPRYATAALLASLTSFFHFFTLSRTFSNSTETALTTWALVYWPFPSPSSSPSIPSEDDEANKGHPVSQQNEHPSLAVALTFAAVATIMRPSNAVIWLVLGVKLFFRPGRTLSLRLSTLCTAVVIGTLASLFSLTLDSLFYLTPTFTPLRFLHFNVLRSISLFYGANSVHFYLSQGIPLLLLTQFPFFLRGVKVAFARQGTEVKNVKALQLLGGVVAATVGAYSLLSHKEWRFLHPLLPVMHLFAAVSLVSLSSSSSMSSPPSSSHPHPSRTIAGVKTNLVLLLLTSLIPAVYFSTFHGLGQNSVMHYLRDRLQEGLGEEKEEAGVGFLMPCHSTGWQAFLHAPQLEMSGEGRREAKEERAWWLSCEPPVLSQDPSTYLDQSDFFYASPSLYLLTRFPSSSSLSLSHQTPPPPSPPFPLPPSLPSSAPLSDLSWSHSWPSRLVLFSSLLSVPCQLSEVERGECGKEGTVGGLLREKRGYKEEKRFWNALGGWNEDERRRGEVVVLRLRADEDEEGE
ncbi:hypothetical protein JCM8547_001284 [Rhodosporidiobolus lusitaniae]